MNSGSTIGQNDRIGQDDGSSQMGEQQRLHLSDRDREFAYHFLPDRESYHHHKETSAYTIFAVEAAFFTALLTTDWYGKIQDKMDNPKPIVVIIIFLIWLLIHRFLRWQLINRRLAALQVGTLVTALLDDLSTKVDSEGRATASDKYKNKVPTKKLKRFLDQWLWPAYSGTIKSDVELKEFPDWYQRHYIVFQNAKGTGALTGEKFPTIGSIFLLIVFLVYVIFVL